MKAVVLAGGLGTRLAEETEVKPKPMVDIGGKPILWHILKHLGHHGVREFVVALGYRGEVIKQFFHDQRTLNGNMTVDLGRGGVRRHKQDTDDWTVHLMETGLPTNTGGGQLSGYYLWGMTPLSEAIAQARGEAGERQVAQHDLVLVSGNGGVLEHHSTLVLSPHRR